MYLLLDLLLGLLTFLDSALHIYCIVEFSLDVSNGNLVDLPTAVIVVVYSCIAASFIICHHCYVSLLLRHRISRYQSIDARLRPLVTIATLPISIFLPPIIWYIRYRDYIRKHPRSASSKPTISNSLQIQMNTRLRNSISLSIGGRGSHVNTNISNLSNESGIVGVTSTNTKKVNMPSSIVLGSPTISGAAAQPSRNAVSDRPKNPEMHQWTYIRYLQWSDFVVASGNVNQSYLFQSVFETIPMVILCCIATVLHYGFVLRLSIIVSTVSLLVKTVYLTYGLSLPQRLFIYGCYASDIFLFIATILLTIQSSTLTYLWIKLSIPPFIFIVVLCLFGSIYLFKRCVRYIVNDDDWEYLLSHQKCASGGVLFTLCFIACIFAFAFSLIIATLIFGLLFCVTLIPLCHGMAFERCCDNLFALNLKLSISPLSITIERRSHRMNPNNEKHWKIVHNFLISDPLKPTPKLFNLFPRLSVDRELLDYRLAVLNFHLSVANASQLRNELNKWHQNVIEKRIQKVSPTDMRDSSLFRIDPKSQQYIERKSYLYFHETPLIKNWRIMLGGFGYCLTCIHTIVSYFLLPLFLLGRMCAVLCPLLELIWYAYYGDGLQWSNLRLGIVYTVLFGVCVTLLCGSARWVWDEQYYMFHVVPTCLKMQFARSVMARVRWDYDYYVWYPIREEMLKKAIDDEQITKLILSYLPHSYYQNLDCDDD